MPVSHEPQLAWFLWSLLFLVAWFVLYVWLKNKESRKEMFWVSMWTLITGFTEPFFVPKYWNPPSLFDLAHRTGFDIESFIFAFAVGGIAVVIYEHIFRVSHAHVELHKRHLPNHRFHLLSLSATPVLFLLLVVFAPINPIYSAIIAMTVGGLFSWYCRPDLKKKMFVSALIFLYLYFIFFSLLILWYPGYVAQVWNLKAISGILIFGVPLEELLFALSFGFVWSSLYEHIKWRKLKMHN